MHSFVEKFYYSSDFTKFSIFTILVVDCYFFKLVIHSLEVKSILITCTKFINFSPIYFPTKWKNKANVKKDEDYYQWEHFYGTDARFVSEMGFQIENTVKGKNKKNKIITRPSRKSSIKNVAIK